MLLEPVPRHCEPVFKCRSGRKIQIPLCQRDVTPGAVYFARSAVSVDHLYRTFISDDISHNLDQLVDAGGFSARQLVDALRTTLQRAAYSSTKVFDEKEIARLRAVTVYGYRRAAQNRFKEMSNDASLFHRAGAVNIRKPKGGRA